MITFLSLSFLRCSLIYLTTTKCDCSQSTPQSKLLEVLLDKFITFSQIWLINGLSLQKEVTSKAEKSSRWKKGHFIWLLSAEKQPAVFAWTIITTTFEIEQEYKCID